MKKIIFVLLALLIPIITYAATRSIVPRADDEGKLGTSTLRWSEGHFDKLYFEQQNNIYYIDATETDQGATGNGRSLKALVDTIGASKNATVVADHTGTGNTTTYTLTTSETIPSNIALIVEKGAILDGAGTLTINGQFIAGLYQCFGSSIDIDFGGRAVTSAYGEWWGINGTADDVSINAAIQSIKGSCRIVRAMARTYTLDGPILMENNTSFIGAGRETIIELDANYSGNELITNEDWSSGNNDILIKDFSVTVDVDDPYTGDLGDGRLKGTVIFKMVDDLIIENIYTEGTYPCNLSVIDLWGGCSDVLIRGCDIVCNDEDGAGGIWVRAGSSDSSNFNSSNIVITDNIVQSTTGEAIVIYGWFNTITSVVISDNIIENPNTNALGILGTNVVGQDGIVTDIVISGNKIRGRTNISTGARRIQFVGNYCQGGATTSMPVIQVVDASAHVGDYPYDVGIIGNYIYNSTDHGIIIEAVRANVVGNIVKDCTVTGKKGIYINTGSSSISVTGNHVFNADYGISTTVAETKIANNYIESCDYGITAGGESKSKVVINDNHIIDSNTCIYIGTTGTVYNTVINDNIIDAAADYGIRVVGGTHSGGVCCGNKFMQDCTNEMSLPTGATFYYENNMEAPTNPLVKKIRQFPNNDATPTVAYWDVFKMVNTSSTTVTMFDDAVQGKSIKVIFDDPNSHSIIDFTGTNLEGNSGADWTPNQNDWMECVFDGTNWFCSVHDCTS